MEEATMFLILKAALDGVNPPMEMSEIQARITFDLAKKQDVGHLIADRLMPFLSSEDKEKAKKQKMVAFYRREALDYEEKRIFEVFNRHSIPHIPLKGSIIKNYYPQGWMRLSSDIDILVRPEMKDIASRILCDELGYILKGESLHDVQLYSKNGTHIELHFALDGTDEKGNLAAGRIWDFAKVEDGCFRYDLAPEFVVFYNILHAKYHFSAGGCGIKPFLDMYVMDKTLNYDKNGVMELIVESGSKAFFDAFMDLTYVWFGSNPYTDLTVQMKSYILSGGVYGSIENLGRANAYKQGGKTKYILNRIFKPKTELEAQYPNLKKHPLLLPYYQVKRWFNLLNKEKRANAEQELSGGLDNADIEKMLKELGI